MKYYISTILGVLLLGFSACVKKDHFGPTDMKVLKSFTLEDQVGSTVIDQQTGEIRISVSADANMKALKLISAEVSSFATFTPAIGTQLDVTRPLEFTVRAENNTTNVFKVIVTRQGGNPQLNNSGFDGWHEVKSQFTDNKYLDIGVDANDKTWGTGNAGGAIMQIYPSVREPMGNGKYAAKLITSDMSEFAGWVKKRTGAGNLFTGYFNITDLMNAAPVFGIPFTATPLGFRVKYKYTPGAQLYDGVGAPVAGLDSCDMYVLLEHRDATAKTVKRLATGWFRGGAQQDWTTKTVDLIYGELPADKPAYMRPQNPNESWGDIKKDKVTHITVVLTSSHNGDKFIGAWGSTLTVDDFELVY